MLIALECNGDDLGDKYHRRGQHDTNFITVLWKYKYHKKCSSYLSYYATSMIFFAKNVGCPLDNILNAVIGNPYR